MSNQATSGVELKSGSSGFPLSPSAASRNEVDPVKDPFLTEQPDFVIIMIPDIIERRPPEHKNDAKYKKVCAALKRIIDESPSRRFNVDKVAEVAQATLLLQQKQPRRSAMAMKTELIDRTNFELESIRHIVIDFAREEFVKALKDKFNVEHMYFVAVHRDDYERRAEELQEAMSKTGV